MNNTLHISILLNQPGLLESMVEKLVSSRLDYGISKFTMPYGLEAINTYSAEAYISGKLEFNLLPNETGKAYIHMPFITNFHFTCIKPKSNPFQIVWSSS